MVDMASRSRVEQAYHHHRNKPRRKCQKRSPQNAAASPKNTAAHSATSQLIAMSGRIHQTNIRPRIGPNTAPNPKRTQNSNRSRGGSSLTVAQYHLTRIVLQNVVK